MHFRDGTEAKIGDACRFETWRYEDSKAIRVMREGVIYDISPGVTTCNAMVAFAFLERGNGAVIVKACTATVTLGECDRAELPIGQSGV